MCLAITAVFQINPIYLEASADKTLWLQLMAAGTALNFTKFLLDSSFNSVSSVKAIVSWIQWSSWPSCDGSSWSHLESSGHVGFQRDLTENGSPTQNVNDIVPWSWWPNWIKRRKWADTNIHLCLLTLMMWCHQLHQSHAATPFPPWWAASP